MDSSKIETGFQLFNRIERRPHLGYMKFLGDQPKLKDLIQITGEPGSGKTLFISELIAQCILPKSLNFNGSYAIFINTDHHFSVLKLYALMKEYLKDIDVDKDAVIKESLNRLIIMDSYSPDQMFLSFKNLEKVLNDNPLINLVAVDCLNAYGGTNSRNFGEQFKSMYNVGTLTLTLKSMYGNRNVITAFTDNLAKPMFPGTMEYTLFLRKSDADTYLLTICNLRKGTNLVRRYKIGNCVEFVD